MEKIRTGWGLNMKLSISNIAWNKEEDALIYQKMKEFGWQYLEIAPTRWIKIDPYSEENIEEARKIAGQIYNEHKLSLASMQSILFQVSERIFFGDEEKNILKSKLKDAINYAAKISCPNLVFGCPKNRQIVDMKHQYQEGILFFREIAEFAEKLKVNFSMEPNPTIYNTNYINTTKEAWELVNQVNNGAFGINYDLGTVIENKEDINEIRQYLPKINHIHISEPYLDTIKKRELHKELVSILKEMNYQKVVSVEMKRPETIDKVYSVMEYITDIFGK
ncbi:sugar phosphate isomerase/epimerase [Clostridiales bacterium COT073_COT-073]|nr:sugar phosphate isomerase/epimerase [Clostridiales bacterium COT073_COT-073]